MLNELSLDGAFRLVEAFGLLKHPDEQPRAAVATARSVAGALGVHLISVQKVTVRACPESEHWRGVC
jgi:hypothetical protein